MFKLLILVLNVLGFWLAADPANAAPVALAISAISTAIQAAGFVGVILKAVLGLALSYGMSLLQKALTKKQKEEPRGVQVEVKMGDDQPISFVIGKYATAGKRKYIGTWGSDGGTPNAYLTDVIEIGFIPNFAGERGITSLWIDDQLCGVLWDQPHPDGRGFPVVQYRVGTTPKDFLWIKFLDGTQTTADTFLLAKFGSHPDRPWKSTMVGRGCQAIILTARYNADLFSGIPNGLYEPHPIPLYDVRKDSTVGGSGSHRWDTPSTWEPSVNANVIAYNVIRGIYYNGDWIFGGQNLAAFRLPASNWMAAQNECDVAIINADSSTEPQFRAGLEITGDLDPLTVVDDMRQAGNGRVAEVGGIFKVLAGAPGAAVYSFTDDDIVVTQGQNFEPFPSLDDLYNGIEATYPEPAEKWSSKDAPARYSDDLEVEDGNRRLATGINFIAVPFANQIQRLMKAMIDEERRFREHNFYLPPDAYPLEPNDVTSWSSARNGYANKKFLVTRIEGQPTFNQMVYLKEIDPSDYDWSSSYQLPTTIGWTGAITAPVQPMTGWAVQAATVKDADSVSRRPAIQISCAQDLDDVMNVWVQVRVKETGAVVFDNNANAYASPYAWLLSGNWCLPATEYEARGKYVPYSNRPTDWSGWLSVTTDDIRLGISDIDVTALGTAISDFFGDGQAWANSSIRAIIIEQQRVARLIIDQDFSKTTDKQQLLTQLTSTTGLITAAYTDAVTVATGPTSAIVQRLTTIETAIPGLVKATVVDALTSRVDTTETGITALAGRTTSIETALPGKASVDSLTSLANTVSSQGDTITAQGTQITSINTALTGKASADSVSSLSNTVSQQGDAITANGQAITSVNVAVGKFSASGMFRTTVEATPSGALSRIGLSAAASSGSATVQAAIYLTAMSSGKSIASVLADQFVILNPDGSGGYYQPFVYEAGVLYVANAKIQQAQIADLMVGKSNISPGAISRIDYTGSGAAAIGTSNTAITGILCSHGTDFQAVLISSSFSIGGDAGTISVVISIWDSYNNAYTAVIPLTFNTATHFTHSYNFTPAAGQTSTTFRFDVRVISGTGVQANNRTIRAETVFR